MSFDADRFRADVLTLLARYAEAFALQFESHALLRQQIELGDRIHDRCVFPGHVTTSALILDPSGTRTLLIRHRSLDRWLQPGGHYEPPEGLAQYEPPEGLAQSALREASEETGLRSLFLDPWHARTGLPLDIDTHRIPARSDRNEPEHWHHDIRYLVRADVGEALRPALDEVDAAGWHPVWTLGGIAPQALANLQKLGVVPAAP
jgi:8-oxo-dGTP pyrophosphatase MutT (NUDIX family)